MIPCNSGIILSFLRRNICYDPSFWTTSVHLKHTKALQKGSQFMFLWKTCRKIALSHQKSNRVSKILKFMWFLLLFFSSPQKQLYVESKSCPYSVWASYMELLTWNGQVKLLAYVSNLMTSLHKAKSDNFIISVQRMQKHHPVKADK